MSIRLSEKELETRGGELRSLLGCISRDPRGPSFDPVRPAGRFIYGMHDGSPPLGNYREWRFATTKPAFRAMYFEVWLPVPEKKQMYALWQAYLHLYRVEARNDEQEVILLHCDPQETGQWQLYKKGPHLHIGSGVAEHPIPKAHIGLAQSHLNDVLATTANLTRALKISVQMIHDEILQRY